MQVSAPDDHFSCTPDFRGVNGPIGLLWTLTLHTLPLCRGNINSCETVEARLRKSRVIMPHYEFVEILRLDIQGPHAT